ncbi:MAG: hypothetical protein EOP04_22005, partial [Proteobacteria bacterium]
MKNNQSGMTLIEIMVAGSIALSLGLVFAEMRSNQAKEERKIQPSALALSVREQFNQRELDEHAR